MAGKHFLNLVLVALVIISPGESAVTRDGKYKTQKLSNWKEKLSQVLDTESQELQILHNLMVENKNEDNKIQEDEEEIDSKSEQLNSKKDFTESESLDSLREQAILSQMKDNSERMDKMVVFLTDLQSVLSQAINAQSKQMKFEKEVVELREEIDFLREEVRNLKHEQASLKAETTNHHTEHRIQNDETIIEWLKDSTKELKGQMNEMEKSYNATAIYHIQQTLNQQTTRQQIDLQQIQKQIQAIQVGQLQQEEKITEAKGDIADVRSWQVNMGQKFVDGQLAFTEDNKVAYNVVEEEEHFLTESLKTAANFSPRQGRHSKKLKAQLQEIHKTTKILAQDHYHINKRLEKLERSQTFSSEMTKPTVKMMTKKSPETEKRLSILEDTMAQYTLSLQSVGDKVNVVNELQESTTQLFTVLENLETSYDAKFTDMQTNLIKMEVMVSGINNTNQDLKEQQTYQNGIVQNVKKELFQTKGQLQKNHFRLASLQTQMLKWAAQKCSIEDSQSIQNIRISSLENFLQALKKDIKPET